ncbi:MAG TPA: hypothetical protein VNO86_12015, partial [Candidatus Binatia bacterium]|nr:hypothetical protein [Candidatus Binatia bacterium]
MSDVLANLDSSDRDRLARALGVKQADDPTFQQRLQALGAMALEEWVDWILSRRRPSTVSSLELERLIVIF